MNNRCWETINQRLEGVTKLFEPNRNKSVVKVHNIYNDLVLLCLLQFQSYNNNQLVDDVILNSTFWYRNIKL
jgi:hypothetical protein